MLERPLGIKVFAEAKFRGPKKMNQNSRFCEFTTEQIHEIMNIPFALVGYVIGYSQLSPTHLVGYLPFHIQRALKNRVDLDSAQYKYSTEVIILN